MKVEWNIVNRDESRIVGKIVVEGEWADQFFRNNVLNLFNLLSREENLIPEWKYNTSEQTKMDNSKIYYLKCYLPKRCEHLLKGMYCEDQCAIEGCIRDTLYQTVN